MARTRTSSSARSKSPKPLTSGNSSGESPKLPASSTIFEVADLRERLLSAGGGVVNAAEVEDVDLSVLQLLVSASKSGKFQFTGASPAIEKLRTSVGISF
jgi:hypothetical protein